MISSYCTIGGRVDSSRQVGRLLGWEERSVKIARRRRSHPVGI